MVIRLSSIGDAKGQLILPLAGGVPQFPPLVIKRPPRRQETHLQRI